MEDDKTLRDTFKFKTTTMEDSIDKRFGETTSWTKFSKFVCLILILFIVQEELYSRDIVCTQKLRY